jgi:uncharacterized protein YceH (UPF0502 family)
MTVVLTPVEARVFGSLIEKQVTIPEYYPLSLNALVNACNQKSNRQPVMNLDEDAIRQALHGLEDDNLVGTVRGSDSRVAKYEHRAQEIFNLTRGETAILCVLLLRGPQTPGELRSRSERLHDFAELSNVQSALEQLIRRDPPLAKALPRQPGTKEVRYTHLLSGEVEDPSDSANASASATPYSSSAEERVERMERLEAEVAALREELAGLKPQIAKLLRLIE